MPFQRTLKANVIDFIFIKTKRTPRNVRLFVQIFKDRRLVYFCTDCHELSQFVFFPFITPGYMYI